MSDTRQYRPVRAPTHRTLDIRGVKYCINEWGDKDAVPVFYLHGWADTGSTFQFVVDAMGEDWRVIAPDWRGFGRTAHRGCSYWFPDYLADLHAIIETCAPDAAVPLIGHSMGGNVASLYAGSIPERVSALINIEGFGLKDSDPADAPRRYRQWIEGGLSELSFSEYPSVESLATKIIERSPGLGYGRADYVARQWAVVGENGVVRLRADAAHKLPNPVLYRRAEAEACWRCITAPVLLVHGDRSPFADQFGSTALLPFPNAESAEVEAAGHMIHFEAPERLAGLIERFLRKTL
ncbi:MAG TPA: alpha/beta hydrolase [Woeseiaceae bacterium]|nr:alpha/beta hydrolase [Woeseiaceae bacterium]